MCGIFGVVDNKEYVKITKLVTISKILKHRGPDDEGFLLFNGGSQQAYLGEDSLDDIDLPSIQKINNIGFSGCLLHRRLSIIDLTPTGHQPMSYNDGKLWIVFNGEIYNYLEIRKELELLGYKFVSTSDTEVVLASYHKWGIKCVERFNGMWAFALWDKEDNSLFLSRDRFGVKPLYFVNTSSTFIFCSEIKGILAYQDNLPEINKSQVLYFAAYGEVRMGMQNEETIFKNIRQLLPGHTMIFKNGGIKLTQYWSVKLKENKLNFGDTLNEFKRLFKLSLNYRLRSDVEVGACLSGGIDSSSIVSYSTSAFGKIFNTFSAVWPGHKCDETYYMQKVNEKWGCKAHYINPSLEDILQVIEQEIHFQEIPLPGSSLIAQWFVMKSAKETGVKVLLDGQGADEILSGYPRYIIPYINELIYHLKWGEFFLNYKDLKANGYNLRRIIGIQKNKVFSTFKPVLPIKKEYISTLSDLNSRYYQYNYLPDYLSFDLQDNCLPALLHFEDRNSMAHSVEARVPFLDFRLAEFCLNIPSQFKIHGVLTKIILREAMKDILPTEIYKRTDKIGFSTPIEKLYFNNKEQTFYSQIISVIKHSRIKDLGLFDMNKIERSIEGKEFRLYSLAKFIDKWF